MFQPEEPMKTPTSIVATAALAALSVSLSPACQAETAPPAARVETGARAPDFSAAASDGKTYTLAGLHGKVVVLYFYPKDDTPGCTVEAKGFRDADADLAALGAVVLGVSRDDLESHQKFVHKYGLNFPLLSDPDGKIHDAFGAWKEGSVFGRTAMGVDRSTFVIDGDGIVRKAWHGVDPGEHKAEVLAFVRTLVGK